MSIPIVVDTNVVAVANGSHNGISPECIKECSLRLKNLMTTGVLVLDDEYLVLKEYLANVNSAKGSRVGDAFVKWALQNQRNEKFVSLVHLELDNVGAFAAFPVHEQLKNFDVADKKFVAIAKTHDGAPSIYQAADSKWLDWEVGLAHHGIKIAFLCPHDVQAFRENKKK